MPMSMCVMFDDVVMLKGEGRSDDVEAKRKKSHPYKRTLPLAETRTAQIPSQNPGSSRNKTREGPELSIRTHIRTPLEESTNDGHVIQSVHHFYVGIEQDFIDSNSAFL